MNERIKELCKEAAEVHLKTMSPKTHTTPLYLLDKLAQSARESGIEIVSDGFCEKFAKLIVEECLKQVEKNFVGAIGTHASAHNSAVLKCKKSIQEHFEIN